MLRFVLVGVLAFLLPTARAADASEAQRFAVLTTAIEAALTTSSLIKDRTGTLEKASWSISYSDRNYVMRIRAGDQFNFVLSGYLWGDDKTQWVTSFAGVGSVGKEAININGKSEWLYDWQSSAFTMNFHNLVKFGENSIWGWVQGAEIIVGGTIGAGGGIVVSSPTIVGIFFGGAAGLLGGAASAVALSDVAKSMIESDTPVAPPELPKRPPIPQNEQKLEPRDGRLIIAISKEGQVEGSGPDRVLGLSGSLTGNSGTGVMFLR